MKIEDEELKDCVKQAMDTVLGYNNSDAISAAMYCIKKDSDRKHTISTLRKIIDHSSTKLVDEIYRRLEKRKSGNNKRKVSDEEEKDVKKPRRFQEPEEEAAETPVTLTAEQIKQMMDNAKQQIKERKNKLLEANQLQQPKRPAIDQALLNDAEQKAQRLAELKKRISSSRMSDVINTNALTQHLMKAQETPQENSAPKPLILDAQGRTIDATGQQIQIPSRVPTLKANIRAKKQEQFRQKLQEKPTADELSVPAGSSYFDSRVKQEATYTRAKRNFKFYEEGKFTKIGQKIRTKAQLEKLQSEISQAAKRTGIQQASKLAQIAPKLSRMQESEEIPHIEWWDSYVYNQDESTGELVTNIEAITNLIEHPIQLQPPGQGNNGPSVLGTYLTKKERKKIRRMNRKEALKDEQEKIRLGLIAPPEPKVKLSNLMRVLGNEAIKDPTKVEQHVRMQMEKRKRAHEHANAARKLTDEQRKEKRIKKLKEDTSEVVHVCIYRVRTLRDPSKKFKVEMNSKQLYMTGCALMHPDLNVVVVEGGPNAQRKFKRLMLHRIKWEEDKKGKRHEEDDGRSNMKWCEVMWSGETKKRNFGEMQFKQVKTSQEAREFFQKHTVEHYWDCAHATSVLQE